MRLSSTVGRAIVTLVAALLLLDGFLQLTSPPMMVEALSHVGFAPDSGPRLAVITLTCAVLLLVPHTAPLGAVLSTGFLGGAITAHVRIEGLGTPPQLICLALGALIWLGLCLTDARVRAFIPLGAPARADRHPGPWTSS
jgi:hypothetical protein